MRIYGERGLISWNQRDFIFIPPASCAKKGLTPKMELLLVSMSTRFATDAPQSEGVVKTLSDAVYSESTSINKLVINY